MSSRAETSSTSEAAGAGRAAFGRWVELMARRHDGSATPVDGGFRVKGRGGHWTVRKLPLRPAPILYQPGTATEWEHRLRLVEKPVAEALDSGPASFSVRIEAPAGKADALDIIRCAIGLGVVSGRLALWRATVYQIEPWGTVAVLPGNDGLFNGQSLRETPLADTARMSVRLEKLAAGIDRAAALFLELEAMRDARREHDSNLSLAYQELDQLYFGGLESQLQLFGIREKPTSLDGAVEGEYRNRLKELYARHRFTIQLRVLSLGTVRCTGRKMQKGDGVELVLPFAHLTSDHLVD